MNEKSKEVKELNDDAIENVAGGRVYEESPGAWVAEEDLRKIKWWKIGDQHTDDEIMHREGEVFGSKKEAVNYAKSKGWKTGSK